jgi:hypothetical protein
MDEVTERSIWKFELPMTDIARVEMPWSAEPLTVQMQNGKPYIWALVYPEEQKSVRRFRVVGTGWKIGEEEDLGVYLGTVQTDAGFVWHVFQLGSLPTRPDGPERSEGNMDGYARCPNCNGLGFEPDKNTDPGEPNRPCWMCGGAGSVRVDAE